MIVVVKIVLFVMAAWQLASLLILGHLNRTLVSFPDTTGRGIKFGLASIGFILAVGLLGVLLK